MSKISWWSQEIEALGDYYIISKSEYKFVEKLMAVAITHREELGIFFCRFWKSHLFPETTGIYSNMGLIVKCIALKFTVFF